MELNTDATVLYDIDMSSVSSSMSSKKNAELIAAAFGCENAAENDEDEDDALSLVSNETINKDRESFTENKIIPTTTATTAKNINGFSSFSNKEDLITITTSGEEEEQIQPTSVRYKKNLFLEKIIK
jgi:hypothetical protein